MAYADSHIMRCSSLCFAMRSALVMGFSGAGWDCDGSLSARSAWASQSSSSQASGTALFLDIVGGGV